MSDKWNNWYKNLNQSNIGSYVYGDTITYRLGYDYLSDCETVQDWGCGTGGFKRFFINNNTIHKYKGVDGSVTPFADIKADLTKYTTECDGIFMRHVLEHNYEWKSILENACKSFNKKMCLILFTPFTESTVKIADNLSSGVDVPDLSFRLNDLTEIFDSHNIKYRIDTFETGTQYSIEHVFYLEK